MFVFSLISVASAALFGGPERVNLDTYLRNRWMLSFTKVSPNEQEETQLDFSGLLQPIPRSPYNYTLLLRNATTMESIEKRVYFTKEDEQSFSISLSEAPPQVEEGEKPEPFEPTLEFVADVKTQVQPTTSFISSIFSVKPYNARIEFEGLSGDLFRIRIEKANVGFTNGDKVTSVQFHELTNSITPVEDNEILYIYGRKINQQQQMNPLMQFGPIAMMVVMQFLQSKMMGNRQQNNAPPAGRGADAPAGPQRSRTTVEEIDDEAGGDDEGDEGNDDNTEEHDKVD
ncbi:hypothetical protein BLNAU_3566 [Blattamonas nauphoetae]|uniref:Uncharacterized protein n=1 Tax=Blattamonas nauphoetae TaxID=2049346 RepID=A0ABQ9YCL9_9EUKA|nr:hypothetical protein BLNAU_3566 [Blattamonas nauphoetae]